MTSEFPHKEEIIQAILKTEPTIKKLFLFGSRVDNQNKNKNADIDLGIIAEKKLSFVKLARIESSIDEIDTLYSIDIVDFTGRNDTFSEEALKKIEVVYEKR
ncbi:MAG: nucleotidyltransferase domain-containing protein [Proteobacteria bacterium]|nr:nucleotidyltransferase domain-containing protein [Pseudomonadota bacterium]